MRIVEVVPRYPPRTGGVETHVQKVSELLVDRGHSVSVLTADDGPDVPTNETRNGVEVTRHPGYAPGGAFHIAPTILKTLRHTDAELVHAHNYHSLPLLFTALSHGNSRLFLTPHYHGGSASSFRDRLLSVYKPAGSWALHQAAEVIAVSQWERSKLQDDFGVNATVIPNGVDVDRFQIADQCRRESPYLLTVGRLEEYKGVQHVIRALQELPEYELVVAGSGPYRDELERIAHEQAVNDRVQFLGYVPDEDLPGLYAGADVYVTTSSFEAYGMTVGEAIAAGTPCVVRRCGALTDWTRRNDCVGVSGTDGRSIARAVETAAEKQVNRDTIPTWEDIVSRLESLFTASQ